MAKLQTSPEPGQWALPDLWLLSDARNDAVLEGALACLPRGSGFVFRHYHLDPGARQERFEALRDAARKRDHVVVLSGSPVLARKWRADGVYGPAGAMPRDDSLLKIATAHDWKEIVAAERAGADAILLSPVFSTASHPDAKPLGPVRFRLLARKTQVPVIALGGMTHARAKRLGWPRWAAIDGLS
ncbi:thiamine phosphate synthase [Qipengyuania sp. RS5-5]|uniref:Thiamine phosphate synthase n=1 Tax=Parerythrobacter lacustris TaxID=2969984 RepID=A0ABT1XLI6_9SPHN|nr:thiamine phosphate synthase [Parerythrobacter lacustris]